METVPPLDIEEVLQGHGPTIGSFAHAVRGLIADVAPDACEVADLPARMVAFSLGRRMNETICTLSPQKGWLTVGIFRGSELTDPAGLLTGTGRVHRHVKVRATDEATSDALRELLHQATVRARSQSRR